jgi:hypothetical protein
MANATENGQGFGNGSIRIFFNSGSLKATARELVKYGAGTVGEME